MQKQHNRPFSFVRFLPQYFVKQLVVLLPKELFFVLFNALECKTYGSDV